MQVSSAQKSSRDITSPPLAEQNEEIIMMEKTYDPQRTGLNAPASQPVMIVKTYKHAPQNKTELSANSQSTSKHAPKNTAELSAKNQSITMKGAISPPKKSTADGDKSWYRMKKLMDVSRRIKIDPTERDVLLGRGRTNFWHEGNVRFREIIGHKLQDYLSATSRSCKSQLVREIAEQVLATGARFVKEETKCIWYDAGIKAGKEKIGHALRDASSDKSRSIKQIHLALLQKKKRKQSAGTQSEADIERERFMFPSKLSYNDICFKKYEKLMRYKGEKEKQTSYKKADQAWADKGKRKNPAKLSSSDIEGSNLSGFRDSKDSSTSSGEPSLRTSTNSLQTSTDNVHDSDSVDGSTSNDTPGIAELAWAPSNGRKMALQAEYESYSSGSSTDEDDSLGHTPIASPHVTPPRHRFRSKLSAEPTPVKSSSAEFAMNSKYRRRNYAIEMIHVSGGREVVPPILGVHQRLAANDVREFSFSTKMALQGNPFPTCTHKLSW